MTPDIETEHRDDETIHTVVLTDAASRETHYPYRETEDGHEFVGEDEPSDRAEQTIEAFEAADDMAAFEAAVEGGDSA